MLKEG
jgi:hypothetical protein